LLIAGTALALVCIETLSKTFGIPESGNVYEKGWVDGQKQMRALRRAHREFALRAIDSAPADSRATHSDLSKIGDD